MSRLLTKFCERAHATLDGMRRAIQQSDWTTLKRDAHSLKGASGYVAAVALKAAAEALERSANESLQGSGTSPAEALAHVEREMARVLVAIEEATGKTPAPGPHSPPLGSGVAGAPGTSAADVPTAVPALAATLAVRTSKQAPAAAAPRSAARSADSTPAINLHDVRATVGGSDAVMVRLLTKFNGRARATIDGMRRAVEESDWTTLKRDSHSLKGASGYVAAMALKEASIALERSADESLQGPPVGTSPAEALVHVEEEMARVLLAIGEATGEPPASLPPRLASSVAAAAAPAAAAPAVSAPATTTATAGPTPGQASAAAASKSTDTTPAINLNEVRATVGGSDAVMMRLLTKFRERAEATLDGMRRAVEQSDWTTLKRDAHSLMGSSSCVAAMALKEAAEALERSADESLQGPPVGTSPKEALADVEREMARVLLAIGEATGEHRLASCLSE
jgi:HPt (histidine-containing phosphotransfer) domain-containing protein